MRNGNSQDKIRVAFDYQIFVRQRIGGISRLFFEINRRLEEKDEFELCYPICNSQNEYFRERLKDVNTLSGGVVSNYCARLKGKKCFLSFINSEPCDIIHATYYSSYFFRHMPQATKYVLTVFDCIQELYAANTFGNMRMKYLKKKAIKRADAIIAISENTKKDIVRLFGVPAEKISVVYPACSGDVIKKSSASLNLPDEYVLYIGNRKGYKNFDTFMKAAGIISLKYPKLKFLCAGDSFNKREFEMIHKEGLEKRFISISATDRELSQLYQCAKCFVYPSIYEGFGLPILEAFENKCPVALSDIEVFREVAGEAALYFSPLSADDMANTIDRLITDDDLRDELIKKGIDRKCIFSWKRATEQTAQVYKNVLSEIKR